MLTGERRDLLEGVEDLDIRVEIHEIAAIVGQKVAQERRLDRSCEFRDVINRRELADFRAVQPDIAQSQALKRFPARIERSLLCLSTKSRGSPRMERSVVSMREPC